MTDLNALSLEYRDPLIGRVLQDRYRVVRLIGRGGMGVVYLAEHVVIQRNLAIKLLHSPRTASEELVERFHREARAAAAAGDEHIVDVTDMGRLDDGTHYMAMEYLDGPNLATVVERDGPLDVARVVDIGLQICDALQSVHAVGIVHRDLKPENVVLVRRRHRSDFVKLLDFGICKVMDERPLTATGVALGTPQFMAPEQLEARGDVDQRADIYALGAMLFFALSGRNAFVSESLPQLLVSVWSEPPPKLRDVRPDAPEALERTIARTLEKHPDRRFSDARELSAELCEVAALLGLVRHPSEQSWASESGLRETCPARDPPRPIASQSRAVHSLETPSATRYSIAGQSRGRRTFLVACGTAFAFSVLSFWLYILAASLAAPAQRPSNVAHRQAAPARVPAAMPASLETTVEVTEPTEPEPIEAQDPSATRKQPRRGRTAELLSSAAPVEPIEPVSEPAVTTALSSPEPEPAPVPSLVPSPAQIKPVF